MDICPTILDMAGIKHPAPTYQGRDVVPMRGASMLPWLSGKEERVHDRDFIHGWELCGRGAIRKAEWKAVFIPKPKGTETWQLYNLSKDPGETRDLAEDNPTKLEELLVHWENYVTECGVVPLQPELGTYVVATEEQMPVGRLGRSWFAWLIWVRRKTLGWNMSIGRGRWRRERTLCANHHGLDETSTTSRGHG